MWRGGRDARASPRFFLVQRNPRRARSAVRPSRRQSGNADRRAGTSEHPRVHDDHCPSSRSNMKAVFKTTGGKDPVQGAIQAYSAGETIFSQGELGTEMFIIQEGEVHIVK